MDLSFIICSYNRKEDLQKVLKQLLNQIQAVSFTCEIIVVDNNSNDGTAQMVKALEAQAAGRLRYLFITRQGKPYALNAGIVTAKAEWMIFTDDDVNFKDTWVQAIYDATKKYPIDCFFGRIIATWSSPKPIWYEPRMGSVIVQADHGDQFIAQKNYLVGANMGVKRWIFEQFGGFNEKISRFEDAEFSLRLQGKIHMAYIPEAVVYHPVAERRVTKDYFRNWYAQMGCLIDARLFEDYGFFGIPFWVYRKLLEQTFLWMISRKPHKRFYHELQMIRLWSACKEKQAQSSKNK